MMSYLVLYGCMQIDEDDGSIQCMLYDVCFTVRDCIVVMIVIDWLIDCNGDLI